MGEPSHGARGCQFGALKQTPKTGWFGSVVRSTIAREGKWHERKVFADCGSSLAALPRPGSAMPASRTLCFQLNHNAPVHALPTSAQYAASSRCVASGSISCHGNGRPTRPLSAYASGQGMRNVLRLLLVPRGRISRRPYSLFFAIFFVLAYLNEVQSRLLNTPDLGPLIQIVMLWPVLVVISRRFQDINCSGWWAALYFAPAVFLGAAQRMDLIEYAVPIKLFGFALLGLVPTQHGMGQDEVKRQLSPTVSQDETSR